jgi:hypothetical protein
MSRAWLILIRSHSSAKRRVLADSPLFVPRYLSGFDAERPRQHRGAKQTTAREILKGSTNR